MTDAVDPSKLLTMLKRRFGHILMLAITTHAQKRSDQLHIIKFSFLLQRSNNYRHSYRRGVIKFCSRSKLLTTFPSEGILVRNVRKWIFNDA